jgi:hypothetical protein
MGFFSNRRDNILEDEIEKVLIFGQGENISILIFFLVQLKDTQ